MECMDENCVANIETRKLIQEWKKKSVLWDNRNAVAKYRKENTQLNNQVARELKDNNKLRGYNTKMFQKIKKIEKFCNENHDAHSPQQIMDKVKDILKEGN